MLNYIIFVCGILTVLYFYSIRTYKYWAKRGVKYVDPVPFFGNYASNILGTKSFSQIGEEIYWKFPEEKAVGYFKLSQPILLVRDPDIIKRVWATDFNSFHARGVEELDKNLEDIEPLRKQLFFVEGDIWRMMRSISTRAFTSSKLKTMFPMLVERAELLQERTRAAAAAQHTVKMADHVKQYTTDCVAASLYGVETGCLKNQDTDFQKLTAKIYQLRFREKIIILLKTLMPRTFKSLKYLPRVEEDYFNFVGAILKQRNHKPSGRHDFIDLFLEIKEKGKIECQSMEKRKPDGTPERVTMELDDEGIASQIFAFYTAGFDSSTTAVANTLHEIAYNPEEQKKIQAEIDRVLAKHNNKLSYEALKEMHYLYWAFKEGLRMFPPVGLICRTCRGKYTFEELGVTVDADMRIDISVQALHFDPKYWDRPEEFRPERFSPEINEPKHKFAYMPFGAGPRVCIGERLAIMQSMAALAAILSCCSVQPAPTSVRHPPLHPRGNLSQKVLGGFPLVFTSRVS